VSNKFWNNRESMLPQQYVDMTLFRTRKVPPLSARFICAMTLLVLAVLLTACACPPLPPSEPLPLPKPPALTEPMPSVSYSTQWRQLVESLQKKLDGTLTMPEPAKTLGPSKKED